MRAAVGSGKKMQIEPLIFEMSSSGRVGYSLPEPDVPANDIDVPDELLRSDNDLPEVSEPDVIRHFVRLSEANFSIDSGFYPLGSCTMKYNPKVNEAIGRMPGFARIHPEQPVDSVQGALELMYELQQMLGEISGMDAVTLQPAAGAHGELTGILMIRAFHEGRGEGSARRVVLVPDSAHGTNPSTAARAGYEVRKVPSNACGTIDVDALKEMLGPDVAAVMLTNPNTLGLYEAQIHEVEKLVHDAGTQIYCDGANMNAIMGISRPGDIGFDVMHFNLHKTFSGPHGGGGPGSGPVGCKKHLAPYLPVPVIEKSDYGYHLDYDRPESIGKMHAFYGNFGVMVRAYAYIRSLGPDGLKRVSETAILNANYLLSRLKDAYPVPYGSVCMHEFVASAREHKKRGVKGFDIAKRLIDYGFHPPTMYFPLIVEEALMIEPTETESVETLDAFADAMLEIDRESKDNPDVVTSAPHTTVISRADEALAARRPDLKWTSDS